MAPATKSNFKSYEAQARLLRAIIAAHPEVKWNYKEVARIFGSSTPDGIQFQFRSIKKDADAMRTAADNGDDPAKALNIGSAFSTPSRKRSTPGVAGSGASSRASGAGSRKRTKAHAAPPASDGEDDDEDTFVETPTKKRIIKQEPSTAASFDGAADIPDVATSQGHVSLFGSSASSARAAAVHVDLTEESEQESRSGNQSTQETQPAFALNADGGKAAKAQRFTASKQVQKPAAAASNVESEFMQELDHAFSNDFVDDADHFYSGGYDEI